MIKSNFVILICFFLAGFAHQTLYFIFPVLAASALVQNKFRLEFNSIGRLFLIFFLFVVTIFIIQSLVYNEVRIFAIKGIFRYFAYLSLVVYLCYSCSEDIKNVLQYLVQIFSFLTPYGILEMMQKDRYVFIFHHSNNLAYVLVLLSLFNLIGNLNYKWYYYSALALSIFLTRSSGGTLVLVSITIFHLLFVEKRSLSSRFIILGSVLSGLILLLLLFPERLNEQLHEFSLVNTDLIYYRALHHQFGSYGSGIWRITYWIGILSEFFKSSYPTIFWGVGLDTMTMGHYAYKFMNIDPHNDYVKVLTEMGIIGFAFLLYFIIAVKKIIKNKFAMIIVLVLPMYFGNILVNFPYMILYILLLFYIKNLLESSISLKIESINLNLG